MQNDCVTTNNQTEVHKKIRLIIDNVIPISESLTDDLVCEIGEELAESCRDYYDFYTEMLRDMYENPGEYKLNAGMYESTLNGRKYYAVRRSEGDAAVKKCPTDLQRSFFLFLMNIGLKGTISGDSLVFESSLFNKLVSDSVKNKAKDYLIKKPADRINLLERAGLRFQQNDDSVSITCAVYPKMFPALCSLAKNTDEKSFLSCPLAAVSRKFKPDYTCSTRIMSGEEKSFTDEIILHMKKHKLKTEYGYGGISWVDRGKTLVFAGYKDPAPFKSPVFTISVMGIYSWNSPDEYLAEIENTSETLKKYFIRHLQYCQACSPNDPCEKNYYNIYGSKKRLCGGACFINDKNVRKENLPYIKQIIDIRLKLLNT